MPKTMGVHEWVLLVTLSILWGGSFFFSEVALMELPPFTVVVCRVGLAAVTLVFVVLASGHRLPTSATMWCAFLVMGALNNAVPFSLIVWGQTQIASGLASILNATTPLFTVILAHYLTREESLTVARLGGVVFGFSGVAVMIGPQLLGGLGADVLAQVAVLGAALSYALAGIFGRRFKGNPPAVTASGQLIASTLLMIPLVLLLERPWTLPTPGVTTWGAIVALALLSTAAAYVIYFRVLARAGATNLLLVTFLIPVSALLLGTLILGERLEMQHILGMALIGVGLAAIDGRPLLFLRSRINRFAETV